MIRPGYNKRYSREEYEALQRQEADARHALEIIAGLELKGAELIGLPGTIPKELDKTLVDYWPSWLNDNNIFIGGSLLGIAMLSGGAIPRVMKKQPKRKKALKKKDQKFNDRVEAVAATLDRAQIPTSNLVGAFLTNPAIALPLAYSFVQGGENLKVIPKRYGDDVQSVLGMLIGGYTASKLLPLIAGV